MLSYSVARGDLPARRAEARRRRARVLGRPRRRGGGARWRRRRGGAAGCAPRLCGRSHPGRRHQRASGAPGAIRYVSDRRPGGEWMLGKPIQLPEARDLYQNGLKIVSCYQFGKQDTADWLGGQTAGVAHAKRGWQLHVAAGGSYGAPIYASIDDDPTLRPVQTAGRTLSTGLGGGARPPAGRCIRQLQNHRLGVAGRSGLVLLAAQLGVAEGVHASGRTPASGRDRQAQRRAASASTSTRSSSRDSGSGTETLPISKFASKLFRSRCGADETDARRVAHSERTRARANRTKIFT